MIMQNLPKADVAVNVFAKPFQLSLAILSLLDQSREHVGTIWFQFEPYGSEFDRVNPYLIYEYLKEENIAPCEVSQPAYWLARNCPDPSRMNDPEYRYGIRYQYAWEKSAASYLFIIHNDVYFFKDLLGHLLAQIGDAAAIGEIGQCWNCPAAKKELTEAVCGSPPCRREEYQNFKCDYAQLRTLYSSAQKSGIFVRSYNANSFREGYQSQPWPLPECRVNEWACLVNLEKTRPLTAPYGDVPPYGAFEPCGDLHLDIAVAWFRGIHRHGLFCRHVNVRDYLQHWVGTGNKSRARYAHAEANALAILKKRFPDYVEWVKQKAPDAVPE